MPGPGGEDMGPDDADGQETVLAQHVLGGDVLDLGVRLRAVQAEVVGHQPDRQADRAGGVPLPLVRGPDPVADGRLPPGPLQDLLHGYLPNNGLTVENHRRPGLAAAVQGQHPLDAPALPVQGVVVRGEGRLPAPLGLAVADDVLGDRLGVADGDEPDTGRRAAHEDRPYRPVAPCHPPAPPPPPPPPPPAPPPPRPPHPPSRPALGAPAPRPPGPRPPGPAPRHSGPRPSALRPPGPERSSP